MEVALPSWANATDHERGSGGKNHAASPAISRLMGVSSARTGHPAAIASSIGKPKPSYKDGNIRATAPLRRAKRLGLGNTPAQLTNSLESEINWSNDWSTSPVTSNFSLLPPSRNCDTAAAANGRFFRGRWAPSIITYGKSAFT